jgi:hypothetical protein
MTRRSSAEIGRANADVDIGSISGVGSGQPTPALPEPSSLVSGRVPLIADPNRGYPGISDLTVQPLTPGSPRDFMFSGHLPDASPIRRLEIGGL